NAFGFPVITTETGGISGVIKQGRNGFMLPLDASPNKYAQLIIDIYKNEKKYYQLIISSREKFDKKLNWDVWGLSFCKLIRES
ncbi:MAG: glycosyltransferase, partial [Methanobacteriaceae archaeon]|nr:glycosyltransferase [Methanobacteriaceae archaeon]